MAGDTGNLVVTICVAVRIDHAAVVLGSMMIQLVIVVVIRDVLAILTTYVRLRHKAPCRAVAATVQIKPV